MEPIYENVKILNGLSQDLAQDVKDIRTGKLSIKKAGAINRQAQTSIKATFQGAMLVQHQQIQRDKITVEHRAVAQKEENIVLQRERIEERKERIV